MELSDLLINSKPQPSPLNGSLLLSEPLEADPYFSRSAIIILDSPPEGGQLGLILNKTTDLTLKDLMPEWENGERVPVYCGGPVEMERMFMLHTLGNRLPGSFEIIPGLYVGGDINDIIDYIDAGGEVDGKMRFFLGYSGWSPKQLDNEIERHVWAVNPFPDTSDLLSDNSISFWRREVEKLGDDYRGWLIMPPDPSFN